MPWMESSVTEEHDAPIRNETCAPRPMKMGNILSPWRYDALANQALQSANLRLPTILRYASRVAVPDFTR